MDDTRRRRRTRVTNAPFHRGEIAAQARYGVVERMNRVGGVVIRDFMPEQHREFFAQLPIVFYSGVDDAGQPWASVLTGAPGFLHSPDPRELRVDAAPLAGDPLFASLRPGCSVGMLGLEFETRRRNRLNGRIAEIGRSGFAIEVAHSFGNCPKYIQAREAQPRKPRPGLQRVVRSDKLLPAQAALLRGADTFFIASHYTEGRGEANEGVDVSHRGGAPGFVHVSDDRTLTWPDYLGNYHFNTIGNLLLNPRAGLLFVDFASGDLLFLAGTAWVTWDGPELARFPGAERLLHFTVEQVIESRRALPFRWSAPEYSRFLPDA